MDIIKASEMADNFRKYLGTNNKGLIKKYTKQEIQSALNIIPHSDRNNPWYKAMERRVEELEKKESRFRRILEKIAIGVLIAVIGGILVKFILRFLNPYFKR